MSALLDAMPSETGGPMRSRFVVPDRAAERVGVSTALLYRLLRDGSFPGLRVRSRWVVPSRAIDAMERASLEGRTVVRADWDQGWADLVGGQQRSFWTLGQAAKLLTTCAATLRREFAEGRFPGMRLGSKLVVSAKAIDAMERRSLEIWGPVDVADWAIEGEDPAGTAAAGAGGGAA